MAVGERRELEAPATVTVAISAIDGLTLANDKVYLAAVENNEVQEIQGLYGPFSLSERVLQKIWLRGEFDANGLRTVSGKHLRVIDPGRWNLLDGPDFLEAQLELDGQALVGDVEVHFHASDWNLHGHTGNPNFARVCLHVVLYPDADTSPRVLTATGAQPELLCLLPLLERDLEDYAIDDALLELEQVEDAEWMLQFVQHPLDERRDILLKGAAARWARKVAFARKRLAGASWAQACHQYCLEVLGYARNRAPMSRIALSYAIDDFASGRLTAEALMAEETQQWRLSGLRPANHPRLRLNQYAAICRAHPDWPQRLQALLANCPAAEGALTGAAFRKAVGMPRLIKSIAHDVFSDTISSQRLNTLICDALLPLAAAAGILEAEPFWQQWPAGDAPDALSRFLKQAQVVDRAQPFANGQLQGGLHLLINR
jgi:hypothetical protein